MQASCAASAAREDVGLPRLVPRAALAGALMKGGTGACLQQRRLLHRNRIADGNAAALDYLGIDAAIAMTQPAL